MKNILFKAKKVDLDKWIEGDLVHNCINAFSKTIPIGIKQDGVYPIEIDPKTVCQFIELTDKKNENIFENHIVRGSYGVKYGNYGQQKDIKFTGVIKYGFGQFYIKIGETKAGVDRCVYFSQLCPLSPVSVEIEIIGNIFDNPELL